MNFMCGLWYGMLWYAIVSCTGSSGKRPSRKPGESRKKAGQELLY